MKTIKTSQTVSEASKAYAEQITLGLSFPQKEIQKSRAKQDFEAGVKWRDENPISKTLPNDFIEKYESSLKVLRTMLNKAGLTIGTETTDYLLEELKQFKTN